MNVSTLVALLRCFQLIEKLRWAVFSTSSIFIFSRLKYQDLGWVSTRAEKRSTKSQCSYTQWPICCANLLRLAVRGNFERNAISHSPTGTNYRTVLTAHFLKSIIKKPPRPVCRSAGMDLAVWHSTLMAASAAILEFGGRGVVFHLTTKQRHSVGEHGGETKLNTSVNRFSELIEMLSGSFLKFRLISTRLMCAEFRRSSRHLLIFRSILTADRHAANALQSRREA